MAHRSTRDHPRHRRSRGGGGVLLDVGTFLWLGRRMTRFWTRELGYRMRRR